LDSLRHAVFAAGIEPPSPAEMDWCVGPPLRTVFERLLNSNEPELIEKAHATYANHYARDGVFKARVFDSVIEMFGRLYERDLRLFVVTSRLALTAQRMVRTLDLN
jgi:phosphoglycolate phosphatase